MPYDEILRSVNLFLGVVTFVWLVARRIRHPHWYPRGGLRRDFWVMSLCWTAALLVGTVEQLFNTGTAFRIVFSMAALLTTLAILARPGRSWPGVTD